MVLVRWIDAIIQKCYETISMALFVYWCLFPEVLRDDRFWWWDCTLNNKLIDWLITQRYQSIRASIPNPVRLKSRIMYNCNVSQNLIMFIMMYGTERDVIFHCAFQPHCKSISPRYQSDTLIRWVTLIRCVYNERITIQMIVRRSDRVHANYHPALSGVCFLLMLPDVLVAR